MRKMSIEKRIEDMRINDDPENWRYGSFIVLLRFNFAFNRSRNQYPLYTLFLKQGFKSNLWLESRTFEAHCQACPQPKKSHSHAAE